jgi:O-antigen/teichoic acid export membrane protein
MDSSTDAATTVGSELNRLVHQSSHYLVGLIANLSVGFISFPIFTRVFTIADYGSIDLIQRVLLLMTAASKVGQQNSALRFFDRNAFQNDPAQARRYYSTFYLGMALTGAAVTVLFALMAPPLLRSFRLDIASVLAFSSMLVLLRALQSTLCSFLRIEERTWSYNAANVAIKAGTVAVVVALLPVMGRTVRTFFTGTVIVEFLAVAVMTVLLIRRDLLAFSGFDAHLFRASILFGAPLILQELAFLVLDSGDRALVGLFLGREQLGLYSVAYSLAGYINTLLMTPLGLAILPIYMRLWNTNGQEATIEFLSKGLDAFITVAGGMFALACAVSRDALVLLASHKYLASAPFMPTLVATFLFYTTTVFLGAGLIIHKRTADYARALTWAAVLNLAMNCVLLPAMGLWGATLANLVSYAFCTILIARYAFRVLPLKIRAGAALRCLAVAGVSWFAASFFVTNHIVVNIVLKTTVVVCLYTYLMYALDGRVRSWVAALAPGTWFSVPSERSSNS